MGKNNWNKIFDSFNSKNVLIIGDVMVDNYMWGKVNRISPEAPVPIVSVEKKESRLGGAANVALNVQALGANPVLCSLVGHDFYGNLFVELLGSNKLSSEGILTDKGRVTTVKTRVIAHNQQLLRVDEEHEHAVAQKKSNLYKRIDKILKDKNIDIIIFEDYDKGVIHEDLIDEVFSLAKRKGIPVTVDPKKKNFSTYKGASIFKPNYKELSEGTKSDLSTTDLKGLKKVIADLRKDKGHETVLLTLSDKGMLVYNDTVEKLIPAHVRQIADVSGAGDTVISVASLCYASGCSPETMAALANLAGGLVCEQVGVVPINRELLKREAVKLDV